jgi:hypothetical protein
MITENPIIEKPTEETESIGEKYGNEYIAKSAGEKYGEDYMARTSSEDPASLTDEQIDQKIEEAGESARVSPLDPDFLVFALPTAIFADLVGVVLGIIVLMTALTLEGLLLAVDIIFMFIIGGWIFYRTGKIAKSKKEMQESLEKSIQRNANIAKRQIAKAATKFPKARPIFKIVFRGVAVAALKSVPVLNFIPLWTISVLETLKEK